MLAGLPPPTEGSATQLPGLWFVGVLRVVYGLMRIFRRKRRMRAQTEALSVAKMSENEP